MNRVLWQPTDERIGQANVTGFIAEIDREWGVSVGDFRGLHAFSIAEPEKFWRSVIKFGGVVGDGLDGPALVDGDKIPGARWFPDARLSFAENLLRRRDASEAMVFRGEDEIRRRVSHAELYDAVSRLAQAFAAAGVTEGDRVAAYLPNMPETVIAMLAANSLGAIWSSCSPDFGVDGVIDRFGQIEPKVLVAVEGYYYGGKPIDTIERVGQIQSRLPSLERTVVVPYVRLAPPIDGLKDAVMLDDFVAPYAAGDIAFNRVPFNHPLYILYSSGTTGVPKCIVHGTGGSLIKHLSEHLLHCDIKADDRVFYFTTCGWMMWNWLVSALACEATLLLYDGSPFYPDPDALFDFADAEAMTLFGTSAKYIDAAKKESLTPAETHHLEELRTMTSTGSPLAPESFDYVYKAIKHDLHLASISGGTDIMGCFVLGDPTGPVFRGEIQAPALGLDVAVFDEGGNAVVEEKGDLVCRNAFPSMPVYFWNDPDGVKYRAAYFERFPGVWCHGDWVEATEHGGMIIYGRSDATLNPGGVRIGTAEIYRQVEQLDEVVEGLAIGQEWDGDTRVVLFVVLRDGVTLSDALVREIKTKIRANCSPRHVPAKVVAVPEIPRTRSGKITELAVRDVVHGRPVKNAEALANAAALDFFKDIPELRT